MGAQHTSSLPSVANSAGIPAGLLQRLHADLAMLGQVEPELAEDAFRYAVDAEREGVLTRLSQTEKCGKAMRLPFCGEMHENRCAAERRQLIADLAIVEPAIDVEVFHRLALIYEAAASRDRQNLWPWGGKPASIFPGWLEYFLEVASGVGAYVVYGQKRSPVPYQLFEHLLKCTDLNSDRLFCVLLDYDPRDYKAEYHHCRVTTLAGLDEAYRGHVQLVLERLATGDAAQKARLLSDVERHRVDLAPFVEQLVGLVLCPAKTVRQAAEPLVVRIMDQAAPLLRQRAESAPPQERVFACQILSRGLGEKAADFLLQRIEQETSEKIKTAISLLVPHQSGPEARAEAELDLPPLADLPDRIAVSDSARQALAAEWEEGWRSAEAMRNRHGGFELEPRPTGDDVTNLADALANGWGRPNDRPKVGRNIEYLQSYAAFVNHHDVHLLHVVRLARALERDQHSRRWLLLHMLVGGGRKFDLRHLAAAIRMVGWDERLVAELIFDSWFHADTFLKMDPVLIWPYFYQHQELVEEAWHKKDDYSFHVDHRRRMVFKVLATFPRLPRRFVALCWDIALGGTKKERQLAQDALAGEADRDQRVIVALSAGKAELRAIAAEWLGRIGNREAIAPLMAILKKEKQEATAGAMMRALELLGAPLEVFISLDGLLKQAKAIIEKGIPKDLGWLKIDDLPTIHWKNGKRVPREIVSSLVLQSHRLGSPEPGPRLRMIAEQFDPAERAELGRCILEAWIAQDTISHTHDQADVAAKQHVAQMQQMARQYPQYVQGTPQQWYQTMYNATLRQPIGSAQAQKGILAVAGACCGPAAAPVVHKYLKTYYGNRAAQCRSLIQMLSWIDCPAAIQVLLSVANRFRTAGIRKEAEKYVNLIAERKNWSLDELADRSIPTGGFEDDLTLSLDFGPRRFIAKLDGNLDIVLTDEEGKTIKALPASRQSDDADKAAAAKKQLSAAAKEIKSVVKLQRDRLYEAMCAQRVWRFADWDEFLHRHPVARHLCRRLIWAVPRDGQTVRTFRPLGDGTMTDVNDELVTLSGDDTIGLAHACSVEAQTGAAWQRHLADYEVEPLFAQFGREIYRLPEDAHQKTELTDFQGYLLEAFKLRGRLTRQGYTRGQAEDGGWFYTYNRHFASLGLTATIEFSGNSLPEENRTIALQKLCFSRSEGQTSAYTFMSQHLALADVPSVLLNECWNDMRQAAGEGTGFDAEWEKKVHL